MTGAWGAAMGAMEREVVAALPALTYRASLANDAWGYTNVQGGLLERLGVRPDDLCGDPSRWVVMIDRADRERVIAERRRAARTGRMELEYRVRTVDGDVCWVHDVAVQDHLEGDAMCGLVVDLTEHRRADDVLEELHDARLSSLGRLLRATSVRDTTVQLFVHDLRSPLTAVAGLARTLHDRAEQLPPEDRDRIFGRMVAAGERIIALVDDFASFWDMPVGDGVPTCPVPLAPLVAEVVAEVGTTDGRVQVDAGDVVAETNPELLRRVLVGLVRNAVDHTPEGTALRVSAGTWDGRVVVDVEDDGPGLPEDLRDQVFRPRMRAPGACGDGMGFGLALVRAGVELLGGEVQALEGTAGGTVFRVALPAAGVVDGVGPAP